MSKIFNFLSKSKLIRLLTILLSLSLLGLESYLFICSCITIHNNSPHQVFIDISVSSFLSILLALSTLILACTLRSPLSKNKKVLIISTLFSLLVLSSFQLYVSILFQSLSQDLLSELKKCEKSVVYASIYWSYKRIYHECEDFETCSCVYDDTCSEELVRKFYEDSGCNGICGIGTDACEPMIRETISDKSKAYVGALAASVSLMLLGFGFLFWVVREVVSSRRLMLQYSDRSIGKFEDISVQLSEIQRKPDPEDCSDQQKPDSSEVPEEQNPNSSECSEKIKPSPSESPEQQKSGSSDHPEQIKPDSDDLQELIISKEPNFPESFSIILAALDKDSINN